MRIRGLPGNRSFGNSHYPRSEATFHGNTPQDTIN
jgi:hypothetical protein